MKNKEFYFFSSEDRSNLPEPSFSSLPRWRGFNLTNKFSLKTNTPFLEEDFKMISSLGFNFVRLPMDYRIWIKSNDPKKISSSAFIEIDSAIRFGIKYGIHICLNLHRAPGYCVNPPLEEMDLWKDLKIQKICAMHWKFISKRYKQIPNKYLSFNLFNEPPKDLKPEIYTDVVTLMVKVIREERDDRLIIADGLDYGRKPVLELIPLRVSQACRGYEPFKLTHYKAPWVKDSDKWEIPSWPSENNNINSLKKDVFSPWKDIEKKGVGIIVGEWGAFNQTPHDVTLRWMEDCLKIWKEYNWGWALWQFKGSFGVAESYRKDVTYSTLFEKGPMFDLKMLELLKNY